MDGRRFDRASERHPGIRGGRGGRCPLHRDAVGGGDGPARDDRWRRARACPCRRPRLAGRARPRRRSRKGPHPPRREARQHPDHRPGPRLPDRLRAHEARQLDQRVDQDRSMGGHSGLHRARADRGNARDAADRRVLAGLRALRGTDGAAALQAGERPRDALGARVCAAAVGARGRPGHTARFRGSRAAGDGQGPGGALCVRERPRSRRACRRRRAAGSGCREKAAGSRDKGSGPRGECRDSSSKVAPRPSAAVRPRRPAAPGRGRRGGRVAFWIG